MMIDALIHIVFDQLTLRVSPAPSLRPLIYLRPVLYRLALRAAFSGLDDTPPPLDSIRVLVRSST